MRNGTFLPIVLLSLVPATAGAQGLAGRYIMSPTQVTGSLTKNVGLCPSRPPRESGGTVDVSEQGVELVFAMGGRRRTTADCWTDNDEVRRTGHHAGTRAWRTTCSTGSENPKVERGSYSFTLSDDGTTLTIRLRTDYAISLAGSECEGSFTVTRTLRNAAAPVAEAPPPAAAPNRCASPGAPVKIVAPPRRRVAAGSRVCIRATVRDAQDCETRGDVSWELVSGSGDVDSRGCIRIPEDASTGQRIRLAARSGSLTAETTLSVVPPDEADIAEDATSLLARDPLPRTGADGQELAAGGEGAGGLRVLQPGQTHTSDLLWPILIIAGLLLVVLAMVLLLVVRTQRRREDPAAKGSTNARPVASARPGDAADAKVVCPTCREEFAPGSQFCPYDATRLLPAGAEPDRPTLGAICPKCHRGYEVGTKRCATDGEELVPYPIHQIARPRHAGRGDPSKICPTCSARYDVDATFCGKDGSELVLVN